MRRILADQAENRVCIYNLYSSHADEVFQDMIEDFYKSIALQYNMLTLFKSNTAIVMKNQQFLIKDIKDVYFLRFSKHSWL